MKLNESERQLVAVLVIFALLGFFYIKGIKKEISDGEKLEQELQAYEASIRPFLDLALTSKAFAIYDTEKKQFLYKSHAEEVMPLASLAKVMSAIVVLENVPADHVFQIDKESLSEIGDNGLLVDEKWGRDELLEFTLVASSNDAIHDIAIETGKIIDPQTSDPLKTFVETMNKRAGELGLRSLTFHNESGLDMKDGISRNGAYSNARDMARLFAHAVSVYPQIFSATTQLEFPVSSEDKDHVAKNTNPLVNQIPKILASKTGFTDIAGGNLVVALRGKNDVTMVVVVLGSTFDQRFSDVKAISGALNQ